MSKWDSEDSDMDSSGLGNSNGMDPDHDPTLDANGSPLEGNDSPVLDTSDENEPGNHYPVLNYPMLPRGDYQDWRYKMRRSCQEIVPDLYLGPYASATRAALPEMQLIGFTHVVCVREVMERQFIRANHPEHFKYLVVELSDTMNDNVIRHMKTVNSFLDECIDNGGRALVHGNGGTSRSAALVMGYLMWRYGITAAQAHFYVQHKRFCVCPSDTFMMQLREYEPIYKALQLVPRVLPALTSSKRPFEEGEDGKPLKNERMEHAEVEDGVVPDPGMMTGVVGYDGMENGVVPNSGTGIGIVGHDEMENGVVNNAGMSNDEMDTEMEDL